MKRAEKQVQRVLDLWRQATAARLTRREAYKMGLIAGTAGLFSSRPLWAASGSGSGGSDADIVSPPNTPWRDPLPIPRRDEGVPITTPIDTGGKQFQYYNDFPPQRFMDLIEREGQHHFYPAVDSLPSSPIWALDGTFPGPTLDMRYGRPVLLKAVNRLPSLEEHRGFGIPQSVLHLHNSHSGSESDGGPWNWTDPGGANFYHYLMQRAGFSDPDGLNIPPEFQDEFGGGDVRETLTTLFLHYHRPEFTAPGVYKGLVNFVRFFDERDTGDEEDLSPDAWRLPSGRYDIPVLIADKQFDPLSGELIFDQFNLDGFLGDKITLNGKIQPFLEVQRRKYRFRLLNGGPARFYTLVLRHKGKSKPFTQITDNGNFLERPIDLTNMEVQPAERSDIIINFSQFKAGDKVYLCNIMRMKDGRGPDRDKTLSPDRVENQPLELRITGDASDPSQVPNFFRPFPDITQMASEVVRTRRWRFERGNGMWQVNGELWDPEVDHSAAFENDPPHQIERNTTERWILENTSGGWEHPVHIHLEEAQILKINGRAPRQKARVDMYRLGRNTKIEVLMRFRDFPQEGFGHGQPLGRYTRYVMHCHNLTHEDHAMMVTWNVVP
jgi:FtsP/CotA-like multicopper oxidase with cupredoxin domain